MGQALPPITAALGPVLLRYDMRPDRTGWTVHDVTDGRSVGLGGVSLVGLSIEDAGELVDMLNRQELEIERTARQHVTQAAGRRPTPGQSSP